VSYLQQASIKKGGPHIAVDDAGRPIYPEQRAVWSLESASLVRSENKNADTEKNSNSDYIARE
jgi:hypothetical protein